MTCRMSRAPIKAWHRWIIPEGMKVTLFSRGRNGKVLMARARYGGEDLPIYIRTINGQLTTAVDITGAGSRKNLSIIYAFSPGSSVLGELREYRSGTAGTLIDELVADDEPERIYRIGPEVE